MASDGFPSRSRLSAHLGYLFTERPLEERFAAARQTGFAAIEHPAPYAMESGEIRRRLDDNALAYVQFALPSGDAARGEKGIAIYADRTDEFQRGLDEGLSYAETLGVTMLHVMAGVVPEGFDRDRAWDAYLSNLALAANAARSAGVTVLIEAMSPGAVPGYLVQTPQDASRAVASVGAPNVKLLVDVFHTASVGADPVATLAELAGSLAHVHVADFPDRHEPGSGSLDFDAIERQLEAQGYRGFVGCEYVPAADTVSGLSWRERH